MIRNLVGEGNIVRGADVLVVGAGTVGLVMATALQQRGLRVLCLESGGEHQVEDTHPLNDVEHVRAVYAGAEQGRFRCLGGTSTRWGGALIPFAAADLDPALWPVGMDHLAPYLSKVEALFGLPAGSYEMPDLLGRDAEHVARLAKWPPFRRRNIVNLVGKAARASDGPDVWLNATATRFKMEDGRLAETTAMAPDGSCLSVRARDVVFCAGAIETTRLVLLLDQQNAGWVSSTSPTLGRGFFDHLSAVVADLDVSDRGRLNRLVGFSFEAGGVMRNMRFELSGASLLRSTVPACFAHVAFEAGTGGGFNELRDLFRLLQRGRLPGPAQLGRLLANAPWLAKAVYWRSVEHRLLYPKEAAIQLHMVIDQKAVDSNRITLSDHRMDRFGMPLARIDWGVTSSDKAQMEVATRALLSTWEQSVLGSIAIPVRRPEAAVWQSMEQGGGIYHPGGSTRMSSCALTGVVDPALRLFAVPNLRAVATSVMPSGGAANPTLTLMMLALRCVDDLAGQVRG